MDISILIIFIFCFIAKDCDGADESNVLGPVKLSLFSKALHNIAASQCQDLLHQNELDDFETLVDGRISKAEETTVAHPHHFQELLNNLTRCADLQRTGLEPESEKEMSQLKKGTKFVIKFFKKTSKAITHKSRNLFKRIGQHFQGNSGPKRHASLKTDSAEIIKKMIDIAVHSCPKSNLNIEKHYLTMIGKFMVLQVELGKEEDNNFSNLKRKITECAKLLE